MNTLEFEDIKNVAELPYDWDKLQNKTFLISGGTGFIGGFLCNVFRYRNKYYLQNIKVISLTRRSHIDDDTVSHISCDITHPIYIDENIDYIIHMASNTHPQQYKEDPVGTITSNVFGCYNLLELARRKQIIRFALASSCEIYGNGKDFPMDELYCGYINSNTARAGYNEAKRVCESLCQSYSQQYGIESVIFRLARVFGADKTKKDTKAMAQFIAKAVNGEDIVLNSAGKQKYSYIYIADAVSGILKVLLDGKSGEAYNISADYDGLTLGEYAEYIAGLTGKQVIYDIKQDPNVSQSQNALLDNHKIKDIGFNQLYTVKDSLNRTINILKSNVH